MKRQNHAEQEIVSDIEAFGAELCGDPDAIANILDALVKSLDESPGAKKPTSGPDYGSYENNQGGQMVAEAEFASHQAWEGLRNQLAGIAHKLRHTADYHI
jgi:hypothetical protein